MVIGEFSTCFSLAVWFQVERRFGPIPISMPLLAAFTPLSSRTITAAFVTSNNKGQRLISSLEYVRRIWSGNLRFGTWSGTG